MSTNKLSEEGGSSERERHRKREAAFDFETHSLDLDSRERSRSESAMVNRRPKGGTSGDEDAEMEDISANNSTFSVPVKISSLMAAQATMLAEHNRKRLLQRQEHVWPERGEDILWC